MKKCLFMLMVVSMLVGPSLSAEMTILIDGPMPGNQGCVDFYQSLFPDATITPGTYHNTTDAGVQAAIEAADVLVIPREITSSGNYNAADGDYYAGLTDTVVIIHTSYVSRSSRLNMESGDVTGPSLAGAETTVTAAGADVLGVPAGNYDFNDESVKPTFYSAGSGTVGTGKILATIGTSNYVVLWQAGDTDNSGREIQGTILLFNIDQTWTSTLITNYMPPTTQAGVDALTSAVQYVLGAPAVRGGAINPVPDGSGLVDAAITTEVSWSAPLTQSDVDGDPNLVSVEGYDIIYYILDKDQVGSDDPNWLTNGTFDDDVTSPYAVSLDSDQTMFWRVDTHVVWDSNEITGTAFTTQVIEGPSWKFSTFPDNITPSVTGTDVVTAPVLLPATVTALVDDFGENDIETVTWTASALVTKEAMQMITRSQSVSAITSDPNFLMDWIGTDTRQPGNPMVLTLKGLPAGDYVWTSTHHDAENQNALIEITVHDAAVTPAEPNVLQTTNGNSLPVASAQLPITSNGVDDVVLTFDLQSGMFFVMNGFELDTVGGSVDPLYIDFGTVVSATDANAVNVMTGYEAYTARHEIPDTFTEQSFSAFGSTVSILPTWGGLVEVTIDDTTNDPSSATQTAVMSINPPTPGTYTATITVTDTGSGSSGEKLSASASMTVTVAADACAAAQQAASWNGFSAYDLNTDCVVDLDDLAIFVGAWLDDRNLAGQE